MERANDALVSRFRVQDFDQREAINFKEKITFTILFSVIFGSLGVGIYYAGSWIYETVSNIF